MMPSQGAVTFIELLIVIIIIGIFASVAVPQFKKSFDNFELEGFVKDIYYLCQYLSASAIAQGKIYYLNINKDKAEFQGTYKQEDEFKKIEGRFGRIYKAPQEVFVSVSPPENSGVYFYPDGASENIIVIFQDRYNRNISLTVRGTTGEIKIQ